MIADDDCRLTGQERYLSGVSLQWRTYRSTSPTWDHDHCEFCWAKFTPDPQPETLHAGYATLDGYHWICAQCFADFAFASSGASRAHPGP